MSMKFRLKTTHIFESLPLLFIEFRKFSLRDFAKLFDLVRYELEFDGRKARDHL